VPTIREEELADGGCRLKQQVNHTPDATAVPVARGGCPASEEARNLRHIALPSARDHDPATLHQEAIAGVDRRVRIRPGSEDRARGAIEIGHGDRVAAIHDVEQRTPAALRAVDRQEKGHVRAPFDASIGPPAEPTLHP
jgi:hypothetical protein